MGLLAWIGTWGQGTPSSWKLVSEWTDGTWCWLSYKTPNLDLPGQGIRTRPVGTPVSMGLLRTTCAGTDYWT